jgi:dTDP-4-dehydrorhamnose reductase
MDDSTIFIVGAKGQLGKALKLKYPNARSVDIEELDITKAESVGNHDWSGIKYVLNAAAYTDVDGAETAEGRAAAWKVNASAVANLVRAVQANDLTLVHISSDYVFDGRRGPHTEDESFSPLGVYAQSKVAGDIAVSLAPKYYILRASWLIGDGPNFVRTMLDLGQKGVSPAVVSDQIGRLTFTDELVKALDHLITTNSAYGTYNVSNGGEPVSWAGIARQIFKEASYDLKVTETTTAEYFADKPGSAPRPLNSTLDLQKLGLTGFEPGDWRQGLKAYMAKETSA